MKKFTNISYSIFTYSNVSFKINKILQPFAKLFNFFFKYNLPIFINLNKIIYVFGNSVNKLKINFFNIKRFGSKLFKKNKIKSFKSFKILNLFFFIKIENRKLFALKQNKNNFYNVSIFFLNFFQNYSNISLKTFFRNNYYKPLKIYKFKSLNYFFKLYNNKIDFSFNNTGFNLKLILIYKPNLLIVGKKTKFIVYNFQPLLHKHKLNYNFFLKFILFNKEINNGFYKDENLITIFSSNNFFINSLNMLNLVDYKWEKSSRLKKTMLNKLNLNNYYPILLSNKRMYDVFFKRFKFSYNLNYLLFNNKLILNFLESFLKKKINITISNNYFNKFNNYYLKSLLRDYKSIQPAYFVNHTVSDFIEILWYSFYLKDLTMLSDWISNFMYGLNFKNHKRFVIFFQNFINRNSGLFMDILKIKGFFFDIRGKVGVTGSSKKRHFFVKFGSLYKSSKSKKLDFNQNLVRSYSGVMGVTYIISY